MSDIKDRLAAAQELVLTAPNEIPKLNELETLKAQKLQSDMRLFEVETELFKIKLNERKNKLQREAGLFVEELKLNNKTDLNFDWNTLTFKESK